MIWETVQTGVSLMPYYEKSEYEGWKVTLEPSNPGELYALRVSDDSKYLFSQTIIVKAATMEEAKVNAVKEIERRLAEERDKWDALCRKFGEMKENLPERIPREWIARAYDHPTVLSYGTNSYGRLVAYLMGTRIVLIEDPEKAKIEYTKDGIVDMVYRKINGRPFNDENIDKAYRAEQCSIALQSELSKRGLL